LPKTERDLNAHERRVYTTLRKYRNQKASDLCWEGFRVMRNLPILQLVRHVREIPRFPIRDLVKCSQIATPTATPFKTARVMLKMMKTDPTLVQQMQRARPQTRRRRS
jgi:hypothetical protein